MSDTSDAMLPGETADDLIPAEEARRRLGVNKTRMAEYLNYRLVFTQGEFDKRLKLVRVGDVARLKHDLEIEAKRKSTKRDGHV